MAITHGNLSVHECSSDAELYAIWPRIRDGINTIEKRCKGVFYRPEDVYYELRSKKASLLIATIDSAYQGFAIIQPTIYPDGHGHHILAMHNAGHDKSFLDNLFVVISEIATLSGAVRVSYSSSRKGWEKRSPPLGYKRTASIHYFERDL